jgi:hypothetical protein
MFVYDALSLLNHFFCDRAIIDKTLFYETFNLKMARYRCYNPGVFGWFQFYIIDSQITPKLEGLRYEKMHRQQYSRMGI